MTKKRAPLGRRLYEVKNWNGNPEEVRKRLEANAPAFIAKFQPQVGPVLHEINMALNQIQFDLRDRQIGRAHKVPPMFLYFSYCGDTCDGCPHPHFRVWRRAPTKAGGLHSRSTQVAVPTKAQAALQDPYILERAVYAAKLLKSRLTIFKHHSDTKRPLRHALSLLRTKLRASA